MKTLKSKVAAIALSATLAMSLNPAAAFADTLASANTDALTTQAAPVTTQAKPKMKTVYVISKKTEQNYRLFHSTYKSTYTYNKNGLLTRINRTDTSSQGETTKQPPISYQYKGINMTRKTFTEVVPIFTKPGKYKKTHMTQRITSKNGLPLIVKNPNGSIYTENKYDKNGYCIESKWTHGALTGGNDTINTTYNAKGLPNPEFITYDKYGNVTKCSNTTYKNTYKNGRLAKTKVYDTYSNTNKPKLTETYTYSYKKMRVPAKYAFVISRQQMSLRGIETYMLP